MYVIIKAYNNGVCIYEETTVGKAALDNAMNWAKHRGYSFTSTLVYNN